MKSAHSPVDVLFVVVITGWWQVALRLLVNSREVLQLEGLWFLLKDYVHFVNPVRLENIYKSLPTVTVIAGPNPVHCRCRSWCESKTHKPTHIPECVSLPCLHKTVMSEIFLCSLNTWSLQFGEMAAWISVLEACPDTVLSSRLPTVSAHTLQLCEPTVLLSQAWVGTGVLTLPSPSAQYFIMSYHSPVKDQRQDYCVLPTPGSGQNNGNTSQKKISALKNVSLLKSAYLYWDLFLYLKLNKVYSV